MSYSQKHRQIDTWLLLGVKYKSNSLSKGMTGCRKSITQASGIEINCIG